MNNFNNSPYFNNTGIDLIQPNQNIQHSPVYRLPNTQPQLPATSNNEFNVKTGGFKFTVKEDGNASRPSPMDIPVDRAEAVENAKKRRGRPRKEIVDGNSIVRDNEKDKNSAKYSYQETTDMLKGTLMQIDQLASEVQQEFESVRTNRTLKNKHNVMIGLSENLGTLINTKVNAIRAINDSITKSNDLDYKREKDSKALESSVNDDKYIMDMYNAFIQNPASMNRNILGPTAIDATLNNSGIVRLPDNQMEQQPQGYIPDAGYLSYVTNMTPEQRLMSLEDNPNIKMCVIFDAATGNKTFQMMDLSTNQAVPGLPVKDPMFMEDTTIDIKNHIAKNINLGEVYPLIIINEDVVKEY